MPTRNLLEVHLPWLPVYRGYTILKFPRQHMRASKRIINSTPNNICRDIRTNLGTTSVCLGCSLPVPELLPVSYLQLVHEIVVSCWGVGHHQGGGNSFHRWQREWRKKRINRQPRCSTEAKRCLVQYPAVLLNLSRNVGHPPR